ncbi:hypothetical protein BHM03_00003932 [Ensete ventricosum]|uniref:Peptidase M28 domain-containing protein n=1 Tax=Ensete ventricosum TaxID=4639 RepID=A0A445MA78_ENSVE|nr:hypothetical protein BHM03_00003932 [Ensete ventricosum]
MAVKEDKKLAKIQNVFGVIRGSEEPDRYVILGNHRDAWTFGAVDPNSGTAALLDVARRYGSLLRSGWRPRRTIILCSWDAEEFGMVMSIDIFSHLYLLYGIVILMFQIQDPDLEGRTVYDSWVASNEGISVSCYYDFSMQKIERLARADSDFSAFLHHAGVPSVDLYYGEGISLIDSLYIIISVIEFVACLSVAELWGLLGLRLADDPVLPFDYLSYSSQLHVAAHSVKLGFGRLEYGSGLLEDDLKTGSSWRCLEGVTYLTGMRRTARYRTIPFRVVSALISTVATCYRAVSAEGEGRRGRRKGRTWRSGAALLRHPDPSSPSLVARRTLQMRCCLGVLGDFSSSVRGEETRRPTLITLLDGGRSVHPLNASVDELTAAIREVYSPPEDSESKMLFFPGIADAISRAGKHAGKGTQLGVHHEIWRVARAIRRVAATLRGELI